MTGSIFDWSLTATNNDTSDQDINWTEGQNPDTVNNSARVMMTRQKEFINDITGVNVTSGTTGALTLTASSAFTTLTDGVITGFTAHANAAASATLNVNGLGGKSLRYPSTTGDVAITAKNIVKDHPYIAIYSTKAAGGSGGWIVINSVGDIPDGSTVAGDLNIADALAVVGAATVGGSLAVTGNTAITGTLTGSSSVTGASFKTADNKAIINSDNTYGTGTFYAKSGGAGVIGYAANTSVYAQIGAGGNAINAVGPSNLGGSTTVTGDLSVTGRISGDGWFPAGTRMLFQQSSAPTGWVKDTTHNNKALRVVSGSVSSGGSVGFTTAFASKSVSGSINSVNATGTVGATTLTATQIPSHAHTFSGSTGTESAAHYHSVSASGYTSTDGSHNHTLEIHSGYENNKATSGSSAAGITAYEPTSYAGAHSHSVTVSGSTGGESANHYHNYSGTTSYVGSGGSHDHTFTPTAHSHTFTGTAIDLGVAYVDVIICEKS